MAADEEAVLIERLVLCPTDAAACRLWLDQHGSSLLALNEDVQRAVLARLLMAHVAGDIGRRTEAVVFEAARLARSAP
jgi:hypothetical protein